MKSSQLKKNVNYIIRSTEGKEGKGLNFSTYSVYQPFLIKNNVQVFNCLSLWTFDNSITFEPLSLASVQYSINARHFYTRVNRLSYNNQ